MKSQIAFDLLKSTLTKRLVLVFMNPSKPYIMFTDASKYIWSSVLTESYLNMTDSKSMTIQHPTTYVSGLFLGIQINCIALTKEAYTMYMVVSKLSFYLGNSDTSLQSDLPLKSISKQSHNKCQGKWWKVELSTYRIQFGLLKGIKNAFQTDRFSILWEECSRTRHPQIRFLYICCTIQCCNCPQMIVILFGCE